MAIHYLWGQSSPFYSRLYAEGLLNTDFFADADSAAGTVTILAGGESRAPETVLSEMLAAAADAAKSGLDPAYFSRVMRAGYGVRVRALSSFSGLCASLTDGAFGGYNAMDAFAMTETVTAAEIRAFIAENLTADRAAMSVIDPLPASADTPLASPSGGGGTSEASDGEGTPEVTGDA